MINNGNVPKINNHGQMFCTLLENTYLSKYPTTIQNKKDYNRSIEIITALQELIENEEAKIRDYFQRTDP